VSTLRPSLAFASCATILVVSLAFAFYRRHSTCPLPVDALPAPAAVAVPKAELQVAAIEPAMAPVRTLVSDTESLRRIAELEAEVSRLRAEVARLESEAAAVRFASTLTTLAPEDRPVTLAQVMNLMESSDLTKSEELRALFLHEVNPSDALQLLQAEPRFRASLHDAYSKATPEWRQYEWPVHRDRILNDFIRHLADAGLSGKAIELYRASIADYL
jgi:uncharacterized small protein (DUF1192 family)